MGESIWESRIREDANKKVWDHAIDLKEMFKP